MVQKYIDPFRAEKLCSKDHAKGRTVMKRTVLKRKTSLRPNTYAEAVARLRAKAPGSRPATKPRATLSHGRKTKEWQAVWRQLKPRFERAGVIHCELRRSNDCTPNHFLTPAHSKKRRNITTPEELREVCIACCHCHQEIEMLPEAEMTAIVRDTISNRTHPV